MKKMLSEYIRLIFKSRYVRYFTSHSIQSATLICLDLDFICCVCCQSREAPDRRHDPAQRVAGAAGGGAGGRAGGLARLARLRRLGRRAAPRAAGGKQHRTTTHWPYVFYK